MKIVWDEPKRLANIATHGFDFVTFTETLSIQHWFFQRAAHV